MSYLLRKLMTHGGYMDENAGNGGDAGGDGGGKGGDEAAAAAASASADKNAKSGPTDEEARLLKESMKRKEENQRLASEKAALEAKLKQFDGIDAEAVKKLLSERSAAEAKQLEEKGDWDRLKTRMAEEHGKEVKTLQDQLAELQGEKSKLANTINELSIGGKFGQSQFISEETTLTPSKARVIYGDHFELVDGEVVGYDRPKNAANRTAIVDQYGNAVPFDVALRKIVEADPEKDHLLKSKVKAGAGSESRKSSGSQGQVEAPAQTSMSKIANGLKSLKMPAPQ